MSYVGQLAPPPALDHSYVRKDPLPPPPLAPLTSGPRLRGGGDHLAWCARLPALAGSLAASSSAAGYSEHGTGGKNFQLLPGRVTIQSDRWLRADHPSTAPTTTR